MKKIDLKIRNYVWMDVFVVFSQHKLCSLLLQELSSFHYWLNCHSAGTKCCTLGHLNFSPTSLLQIKTLPKAQGIGGNEYFDSFNTFSLKQKPQQGLKSLSNFSLVLFGKGREIQRTTFPFNPFINFDKSM